MVKLVYYPDLDSFSSGIQDLLGGEDSPAVKELQQILISRLLYITNTYLTPKQKNAIGIWMGGGSSRDTGKILKITHQSAQSLLQRGLATLQRYAYMDEIVLATLLEIHRLRETDNE